MRSTKMFSIFLLIVLTCASLVFAQEWTTSGSDIYNSNSGNVGIGTTSPGAKLHLNGTGYFGDIGGNSAGWDFVLGMPNNDGLRFIKHGGNTSTATDVRFSFYQEDINGALMDIYDASGNVKVKLHGFGDSYFNGGDLGIGTASPDAKLRVEGDIKVPDTGAGGYLKIGSSADLQVYHDGNNSYVQNGTGNLYLWTDASTQDLQVYTNATRRMTFKGNGPIGIGTGSPSSLLHLKDSGASGDELLRLGLDGGRDWVFEQLNSGPGTSLRLVSTSNKDFYVDASALKLRNSVDSNMFAVLGPTAIGFYDDSPDADFELVGEFMVSATAAGDGDRFIINTSGNVGVGTVNPIWDLQVDSDNNDASSIVQIKNNDGSRFLAFDSGNSSSPSNSSAGITYSSSHGLKFGTWTAHTGSGYSEKMRIDGAGNVGIGLTDPGSYKLNVDGKVRADEIVVNTTGADFVFEEGYELMSLEEVEKHIKTNKHLPDIPPAKEVTAHGVSVGEMQTKLLLKIEEMTLYVIDLKKDVQRLEQEKQKLKQ